MNAQTDDTPQIAVRVAAALEASGIRYVIGGSMASSIAGEPRSTLDIDMAVELSESALVRLAAALGPDFYFDIDTARSALQAKVSFNAIHIPTNIKVDFFAIRTSFERLQAERRQLLRLAEPDGYAYVCTAEDVLLQKPLWYRAGGEISDRQRRDVMGIVRVQGERLDRGYLQVQAEDLGVADLLERVLAECGEN